MTRRRASRSRYSGRIGSRSPKRDRMSFDPGFLPRKYSSRLPGLATGSKSGLGMNRFTLPPTRSRRLPLMSAHCMARLAMTGSMCRV